MIMFGQLILDWMDISHKFCKYTIRQQIQNKCPIVRLCQHERFAIWIQGQIITKEVRVMEQPTYGPFTILLEAQVVGITHAHLNFKDHKRL